ncbi:MAG: maleylacetoacetate isomerase [Alphaproteobacteria bacterium]|nr:maleylacetoacetate isomerase [Alphaproteobacteria bacterium]
MKFFGYFRSSSAYRCRIAFNIKGIEPEESFVHLRKGEQRSPEYLRRNPLGLVPTLELDRRTLAQSLAIVEWLEEMFPEPPLLPRNPLDRAYVRALSLTVACEIHPLQNLRVLDHLKTEFGQDQEGLNAWCQKWIRTGLEAYEGMLAQSGLAGAFSFGDEATLADICLIPQVFSAQRFKVDISDLEAIQKIAANAERHPAFSAAHPAKQPDAE